MNISICNMKCKAGHLPKYIARYSDTGKWYLFFDAREAFDFHCNVIEIEPMKEFLEKHKKRISKNWRKITGKLRVCDKISDYWEYIGGDWDYVLSNAHIVCNNSECPCKYTVEQTMYDIKHNERIKRIRENEKVVMPDGILCTNKKKA